MRSETAEREGIDNRPGADVLDNLSRLATGLEAIAQILGHPLVITSAWRCEALNQRVGGTPRSQHSQGLAADFVCPDHGDAMQVARTLTQSTLEFDQCILEYGRWVHVSFSAAPRRRTLTIRSSDEGYLEGLHPMPADPGGQPPR
jgi:hypothetical protein